MSTLSAMPAPPERASSAPPEINRPFTRNLALWLFAVWATGGTFVLARIVPGLLALRRLERQTRSADNATLTLVRELSLTLGLRRKVRVRVPQQDAPAGTPMTWGAYHPVLLLPTDAEGWQPERLRAVVLHELAHISRHDWAARLLADLACACYWFHPLVWLTARRLCRDCELACDDRVLAAGVRPSDYAAHLLEIVRLRKAGSALPSAAISMAQPSLLEARMRALFDPDRSRNTPSRTVITAAIALLLLPTLPLAAAHIVPARVVLNHAPNALIELPPNATTGILHNRRHHIFSGDGPSFAPLQSEGLQPFAPLQAGTIGIGLTVGERRPEPVRAMLPADKEIASQITRQMIAWGTPVQGLQVGLERTDGPGAVRFGAQIRFRLWIRNSGKKTLNISYEIALDPKLAPGITRDWSAVVASDANASLELGSYYVDRRYQANPAHGAVVNVPWEHRPLTLLPGEQRILTGPEPNLTVRQAGNNLVRQATAAFLKPGRKTFALVQKLSISGTDYTLVTGRLAVDVNAAEDPHARLISQVALPEKQIMDLKDVEWGAVTDGLQAGIRIAGTRRRFAVGERVPMECFLRNASDHEIACTYAYRVYNAELPSVRDAAGAMGSKNVQGVDLLGRDSAVALVLQPGDAIVLWHPGLVLGDRPPIDPKPEQRRNGLERWPFLAEPTPGDYLAQQAIRYQRITPDDFKALEERSRNKHTVLTDPYTVTLVHANGIKETAFALLIPYNDVRTTLTTGETRFSIAIGGKTAAPSTQKGIAWGEAQEGLQAGIRLIDGKAQYSEGEIFKAQLLIRNAGSSPITFQYTLTPDLNTIVKDARNTETRPEAGVVVGMVRGGLNAAGRPAGEPNERSALRGATGQATLLPGASVVIEEADSRLPRAIRYPDESYHITKTGARQALIRLSRTVQMHHDLRIGGKDVTLYTGWIPYEVLHFETIQLAPHQ